MDPGKDLQIRPSLIDGLGIFALSAIPAETPLLEYVGQRITREEYAAKRDRTYCFEVGEYVIDGSAAKWNPAGFINHSCEPNCEPGLIEEALWIITRRDIKPGEELTFNYGYLLEDFRSNPCQCGAPGCVGFMVAEQFFPTIRQMRENGELSA